MSELKLWWERIDTATTAWHSSVLRWCPIVSGWVEISRCRNCRFAVNTSGECGFKEPLKEASEE